VRTFDGVDALAAAAGEHLGYSGWVEIDQRRVDTFADATDDHQWIHVDPQRAADGPCGGTVAHGYLTLSLVPRFVADVIRIDGLTMRLNYGLNKVRFPAPVRVGSRVRGGVAIVWVTREESTAQLVLRTTVEIEGGDKPACVAETVTVLVPRPRSEVC
jgi:acyl dehydratase